MDKTKLYNTNLYLKKQKNHCLNEQNIVLITQTLNIKIGYKKHCFDNTNFVLIIQKLFSIKICFDNTNFYLVQHFFDKTNLYSKSKQSLILVKELNIGTKNNCINKTNLDPIKQT